VARTLNKGIELISNALELKLRWIYPTRHRRDTRGFVALTIARSTTPSSITRQYWYLATTLYNEALTAGVHSRHERTLRAYPRTNAQYARTAILTDAKVLPGAVLWDGTEPGTIPIDCTADLGAVEHLLSSDLGGLPRSSLDR